MRFLKDLLLEFRRKLTPSQQQRVGRAVEAEREKAEGKRTELYDDLVRHGLD